MTTLMEQEQDAGVFDTFTRLLTDVRDSYLNDVGDTTTEAKFQAMYNDFSKALDNKKEKGMSEEDIAGIEHKNLKTLMLGLKDLLDIAQYKDETSFDLEKIQGTLSRKMSKTTVVTTATTVAPTTDLEGVEALAQKFCTTDTVDDAFFNEIFEKMDNLMKLGGSDGSAEDLRIVVDLEEIYNRKPEDGVESSKSIPEEYSEFFRNQCL